LSKLTNVDSNGIVFTRFINTLKLSFLHFLQIFKSKQRNSIIHHLETAIPLKKSGMKNLVTLAYIIVGLQIVNAQNATVSDTLSQSTQSNENTQQVYKIIKTDGGELLGKILTQNNREILLQSIDGREIYIPQHKIQKIEKLDSTEFNQKGEFVGNDPFATRYFLSTNGFALKEGDSYILYNWWGPEIQFGLKNNISLGVISTWIGAPIIGTIKKSWEINKNKHVAIGALLGTGSYGRFDLYGGLPFASLTLGEKTRNVSLSAGYGAISYNEFQDFNYTPDWQTKRVFDGATMFSVSGMFKVSTSISFVFESFFAFKEANLGDNGDTSSSNLIGFVSPGFRFQQNPGKAFQVGFTGAFSDGIPIPIPMIQWYRKF